MAARDPYELLGVPRDASPEWVRDAYEREIARALRAGATRQAVDISAAYDTLSSPASRALYDRHGVPAVRERSPGAAPLPTPWRIAKHESPPAPRRRGRSWRAPVLAVFSFGIIVGLLIASYAMRAASNGSTVRPSTNVEQQVLCDTTPAGQGFIYSEPAGTVPHCSNGAVPRVLGTSPS